MHRLCMSLTVGVGTRAGTTSSEGMAVGKSNTNLQVLLFKREASWCNGARITLELRS